MQAFMPSTPVKAERRKKLRKKPLRLIYVELAFGNGGMMRDLSEEGFAVRAMMPVKKGDKTPFSFALGDVTRVEGEGRVLWIDEGGRVAGVEFTQISSEMKSQIDDWLIEDEKITDPREIAKGAAIAPASTMDELREEIRSTPVRAEASAPVALPEEQPRIEEPPPVALEAPKAAEPKIEAIPPAKPEVRIAAEEITATKKEVVPKTEPKPPELAQPIPAKVISETEAPSSSVTEGFFRTWPKAAPASADVGATPAPDLPPLPRPTPVAPARHAESRPPEEEEADEVAEAKPPLPDISEILIQPHGLSSPGESRHDAMPPFPETQESRPTTNATSEWFTLGHAVLTMVILTVLVSLFVYHREVGQGLIWLGEAMGGASGSADNAADRNNTLPGGDASQTPLRSANGAPSPTFSSSGPANNPPSLSGAPRGSSAAVTPLASPEASADSGQAEYLQAVQLMRGRNSAGDGSEAVRLLWMAVEKGNPSAEVSLADLYWHGQGVVRNCDQARILFTAAARKGSSEAQKRLQQFQQEGCG